MSLQSGAGVPFIKLSILQAKAGADLLTCSTFLVVRSFFLLGGGGVLVWVGIVFLIGYVHVAPVKMELFHSAGPHSTG